MRVPSCPHCISSMQRLVLSFFFAFSHGCGKPHIGKPLPRLLLKCVGLCVCIYVHIHMYICLKAATSKNFESKYVYMYRCINLKVYMCTWAVAAAAACAAAVCGTPLGQMRGARAAGSMFISIVVVASAFPRACCNTHTHTHTHNYDNDETKKSLHSFLFFIKRWGTEGTGACVCTRRGRVSARVRACVLTAEKSKEGVCEFVCVCVFLWVFVCSPRRSRGKKTCRQNTWGAGLYMSARS